MHFGAYSVVVSNAVGKVTSALATLSLDPFRLVAGKSDLQPDQSRLVLRLSGATAGDVVVLSSSLDLINWVPWLTNLLSAQKWEAHAPWARAESHRFFRATRFAAAFVSQGRRWTERISVTATQPTVVTIPTAMPGAKVALPGVQITVPPQCALTAGRESNARWIRCCGRECGQLS